MKADLFVEMDEYIKRANGATDPEVVAACNNILVAKPLSGSIIGMAMRYSTLAVVSVNGRLDKLWHDYALMHEITHVARGHTKPIFAMDFQNDGEYVGGCIAGGRRYLHINANGDCDPCVFIHYSNANIRDMSLLDVLRSPIFMAYHDGQPFNDNHLRPCPMLENPEKLREIVKASGAHSTDLQSPETVDYLCDKCEAYAKNWTPTATELWSCSCAKKNEEAAK